MSLPAGRQVGTRRTPAFSQINLWGEHEPHVTLSRLLEHNKVPEAEATALLLIDQFGSVLRVLAASWWTLCLSSGPRAANAIAKAPEDDFAALSRSLRARPQLAEPEAVAELFSDCEALTLHCAPLAAFVDIDLRVIRVEPVLNKIAGVQLDIATLLWRASAIGATGLFIGRAVAAAFASEQLKIRAEEVHFKQPLPLMIHTDVQEGEVVHYRLRPMKV